MSNENIEIKENDPLLEEEFAVQLIRQMRGIDSYGTYDDWSTAKILDPFILTKDKRREIPIIGDPDEIVIARVKVYYNAISSMIEKETGLMAVPIINITHEGFGRAIICVGKLIVVDKTLRDVHRFGFLSLEKLQQEITKLVSNAVSLIEQHRVVAEL